MSNLLGYVESSGEGEHQLQGLGEGTPKVGVAQDGLGGRFHFSYLEGAAAPQMSVFHSGWQAESYSQYKVSPIPRALGPVRWRGSTPKPT